MISGYLPVLGSSFALIAVTGGQPLTTAIVAPEDERDLAGHGRFGAIVTFSGADVDAAGGRLELAARHCLAEALQTMRRDDAPILIGYEGSMDAIAPAYSHVCVPSTFTTDMYRTLVPGALLWDAGPMLDHLKAIKMSDDTAGMRQCVAAARAGFAAAREALRAPGATEADIAAVALETLAREGARRSAKGQFLPFVHVMSGPRSAEAYKAYNLTSYAAIAPEEPVLVQMEVGIDGYWAELTRTFFVGRCPDMWTNTHQASIEAQIAALAQDIPRNTGHDVDSAARQRLARDGWAHAFKHGVGHGVGFQAINHGARPRLAPESADDLLAGMTHNLEPAVYLDGAGGLRLNDNVLIRGGKPEVLSDDIPHSLEWLVV